MPDGSVQSPSGPAKLTLILEERDEMKLGIVLELDLGIHNEWPFLGIVDLLLGFSGEKGNDDKQLPRDGPGIAATSSQTAWARD